MSKKNETFQVKGEKLIATFKKLVKEGNVRRITLPLSAVNKAGD